MSFGEEPRLTYDGAVSAEWAGRPVMSFGEELRRAREGRRTTLRQVASITKISVSTLQALEAGDISRLPGGIFSRGVVRAYAAEVGLDPEASVARFLAAYPAEEAAAGSALRADVMVAEQQAADFVRTEQLWRTLLFVVVPLLAAIGLFILSGKRERVSGPAVLAGPEEATSPATISRTAHPDGLIHYTPPAATIAYR